MKISVYGTTQSPPYWNGWALSACMHTVVVGAVLFLSQQLPTPQKVERTPIAVAFVTPQPTRTPPTHRQTMKKSPPTPTIKPKHVQPEIIPREPVQSKPHTQTQPRQKKSAQTVVQTSPKPAPLPKLQVTNATPISVAQPKTLRPTQTTYQPAISSGVIASQPMPRHTDIAQQDIVQQHAAPKVYGSPSKVHASPSHKKPIHVEAKTNKVDAVTSRDPVIRNHVTNVPQPMATPVRSAPLRQSVNALQSHVEKRVHAQTTEVTKQRVTTGKSHAAMRHVVAKRARQQASLSSGSPVVQTRTTVNYTHQTRKARPMTTSMSVSTGGLSPELLAFSKLLREKVARTLRFPRLAKRLGYSGTTHVAISLSKTGIVRNLKISQPSGYEILDKAAMVTLQEVLQTTKPPESIEIEQLVIPIAFNLKRH